MRELLGKTSQIESYRAADGRLIGLYVPGDFTDYASFPPFVDTPEEIVHLREAYKVLSPQRECETKAHVTADELPLQIVLLNRDPRRVCPPRLQVSTDCRCRSSDPAASRQHP